MTIYIEIDGESVTLRGTTKGDPVEAKARQGTAWRWSPRLGAFVLPRNLQAHTRTRNLNAVVARLRLDGREVVVTDTGTVLSVAERREAQAERLEARADRLEHRAEKRQAESDAADAKFRQIADVIPMGQPVLIDHYSAKRHLKDIERMGRATRTSIDAGREAEEAARHAENIRAHLEKGDSVGTIRRRIDKAEAELRSLDRRLHGTGKELYGESEPATGAYAERLTDEIARLTEQVALDKELLAASGKKVWTRDDFVKGDEVACYSGWQPVLRVNAKSLTVPWWGGGTHTDTIPYDSVQGRRRNGEVTQ